MGHLDRSIADGTDGASNCPFCMHEHELIADSTDAFAILDKFPVNPGHVLVIPKRHVASYFDLSDQERLACWLMVQHVQHLIQERHNPDGFNLGINIGMAAGQTIYHVHIHLIPRYLGDIPEPRGGVRGVIPDKRNY